MRDERKWVSCDIRVSGPTKYKVFKVVTNTVSLKMGTSKVGTFASLMRYQFNIICANTDKLDIVCVEVNVGRVAMHILQLCDLATACNFGFCFNNFSRGRRCGSDCFIRFIGEYHRIFRRKNIDGIVASTNNRVRHIELSCDNVFSVRDEHNALIGVAIVKHILESVAVVGYTVTYSGFKTSRRIFHINNKVGKNSFDIVVKFIRMRIRNDSFFNVVRKFIMGFNKFVDFFLNSSQNFIIAEAVVVSKRKNFVAPISDFFNVNKFCLFVTHFYLLSPKPHEKRL